MHVHVCTRVRMPACLRMCMRGCARACVGGYVTRWLGVCVCVGVCVCGSGLVSRARRILRAHVYCARRKEGRGKNTSGVFGQVFVCTAGMLAVPIRLQYRVINIINT